MNMTKLTRPNEHDQMNMTKWTWPNEHDQMSMTKQEQTNEHDQVDIKKWTWLNEHGYMDITKWTVSDLVFPILKYIVVNMTKWRRPDVVCPQLKALLYCNSYIKSSNNCPQFHVLICCGFLFCIHTAHECMIRIFASHSPEIPSTNRSQSRKCTSAKMCFWIRKIWLASETA